MLLLKSNNYILFKGATVLVSTVKLRTINSIIKYETCVFTEDESDVIDEYDNMLDAIKGHNKHSYEYGCR